MLRKVSVAPMMDCTDRHDRFFLRLISKNVMLYSEMIVSEAIKRGDKKNLLNFNIKEKPLALQIGGSSPKILGEAAKIGEDFGYDEINLNLGCPSKKVQKNKFGACLMQEPDLVAECVNQMKNSCKIPISIKTRIGFDDQEDYDYLKSFIKKIKDAGCNIFIIHARKAILKNLSPKQNLRIPPLNYEFVYQLKKDFFKDEVILNGGVVTTNQLKNHLKKVDGVMIGRAIYHSPYLLSEIEREVFNNNNVPTRLEVIEELIKYLKYELTKGVRINQIMRHTLGLFHGQEGSSFWKRYLSKNMCVRDSDLQKVNHIMDHLKKNNIGTNLGT